MVKNVFDERQCPDQILLGAADDDYCTLIMLSIYMESCLEQFPETKLLFTENTDGNATINLKHSYRSHLKSVIWSRPEFKDLEEEGDGDEGGIGTHSTRKLPATYASNCGCNEREIEIRGRWKNKSIRKIVEVYIDVRQLYHDAKVASVLLMCWWTRKI